MLIGNPIKQLLAVYSILFDSHLYCVSGQLWNVAFGSIEAPIFRQPDFYGAPNFDRRLSKDGLLLSFNNIKGILFYGYDLKGIGEPLGLIRRNDELSKSIIQEITNMYNDNENTNYFVLEDYCKSK